MTQTFQSFNGDKINQYLIRINCNYYTFTATHSLKIPAQKITKDLCFQTSIMITKAASFFVFNCRESNKMGVR